MLQGLPSRAAVLATLLSLATAIACGPGAGEQPPPNVVIFLADDQGWGDLGVTGNTNVNTPNIDRLARAGAAFTHFYVSPVCSPTRAELLTGRYHPRSGVYATSTGGERMDLDETTLAEVFQAAGYATAAFGKWHNGSQPPYHPNARGFDEFYGFTSGHWGHYFSPPLDHNGRVVRGNGYVTDDFSDRAIRFIENHRDRPFFVYLAYNTPHSPMQVPDRWWTAIADDPIAQRHRDPEKERLSHTRAALAMTENIDWNVGRVVAGLDELGLTDDTIVVYFSDNGPNGWRWNGGLKGRKGSTDEGGVRSPLFIRWPREIGAGTTVDRIAGAIDLLPTLADLAGIGYGTAHPLDGLSLTPLLDPAGTAAAAWPDRVLVNHWRGQTSIRGQRYRLDAEGQLFDMIADPGQRTDVSARQPDATGTLTAARDAWTADVLPQRPDTDDRPFPIGHPGHAYTHLPARDGIGHGGIRRSNRYPNDSFFTNWTSLEDAITWDVEVLADGRFEVTVYYTCADTDAGARVELRLGEQVLAARIAAAHDPPLIGMEQDRDERIESYVKEFRPLVLGDMELSTGRGTLSLHALEIPGAAVMDVRLLVFRRIGGLSRTHRRPSATPALTFVRQAGIVGAMNENRLVRSVILACIVALPAALPPLRAADRPNIILLMGDDHGWEETGYNGHAHVRTPVLDTMASEGLRLDRFYAGHPSCSPTRGSVLTGRHPNRYGTFAPNWSIRPEEITIAHLLREAGYATGHFGKWHVGPVKAASPTSPGAMGFDEWLSHDNFFELNPSLSRNGAPPRQYAGESSAIVVDEAMRFIERSRQDGRPFLAVVWFGSPHEPYSGLEHDLALYDSLPAQYAQTTVTLTSNETGLPVRRPLGDVLRERYAEITAMDRAIGTLRTYLEDEGLRDNTLLWYAGDNGTPPSGVAETPLRGRKGTMYEGGIRVPGIIEWPARVPAPRTSRVAAVTSDILPTLAALAGRALPDRPLDGVNLEPLIDGAMTARPAPIFFWSFNIAGLAERDPEPYIDPELQDGTTPLVKLMDGLLTRKFQNFNYPAVDARDFAGPRVVLDNDYKLVIGGSPGSGAELFNLRDDTAETHNLAATEPAVVQDLERRLREWQHSTLHSLTGADYR